MKYFSEVVNKVFDTEDELKEAEAEHEKKMELAKVEKEARAADAKEVEEAYKEANEAYKKAQEKMHEFCKKHGAYHKTITSSDGKGRTLFDYFFDEFFF